jgi:hypothetical protein
MTDRVRHLLGGYATGTLTPQENEVLFSAALEDQELFDALADDEALRKFLADPSFRNELLKATAPQSARKTWRWIAAFGAAAAALALAVLWIARPWGSTPAVTARIETAQSLPPVLTSPVVVPPPPAVSAPQPPRKARKMKVAAPDFDSGQAKPGAGQNATQNALANPPAPSSAPSARATASARMIDSTTGKSLRNAAPAVSAHLNSAAQQIGPALEKSITAKITDVNAAILTLDAGSQAGIQTGDRFNVLRNGVILGTVVITTSEPAFAVGRYTGTTTARIGDAVSMAFTSFQRIFLPHSKPLNPTRHQISNSSPCNLKSANAYRSLTDANHRRTILARSYTDAHSAPRPQPTGPRRIHRCGFGRR